MGEQSRPVTGYPAPPPPAYPQSNPRQATNSNPNGYTFSTTTATAYPYNAPPSQQPYYYNQNPFYYNQDYLAARRATFIRRLFGVLIAAVIIAGTITFIFWLILRPRLPDFSVDSLSLSGLNISSSSSLLSGNWDARFTVYNPNKKITLSYDHVVAEIYYKSEFLSQTTLRPFFQDKRNQTTVTASFAASSAYVDGGVVQGINGGSRGGSGLSFNIRVEALVRLEAGLWSTRERFLTVYCGDLTVGISSNSSSGSLTGGSKQCRVGL